jgi:hypothetical protein
MRKLPVWDEQVRTDSATYIYKSNAFDLFDSSVKSTVVIYGTERMPWPVTADRGKQGMFSWRKKFVSG